MKSNNYGSQELRKPVQVTETRAVLCEIRCTVHTHENTGTVYTLNRIPAVIEGTGTV
jgi:hypothetical protein